jgi:hypothetical protein
MTITETAMATETATETVIPKRIPVSPVSEVCSIEERGRFAPPSLFSSLKSAFFTVYAQICAAFLLSLALLGYIQFAGPNIVDYDGYYHIKMAQLIREQGLPTPFPYLPLTILDEKGYNDHHTLLHVLQIPFTYVQNLGLAAKLSAVFCAALAFTAFFWLLKKYRLPYPWIWLILLFASSSAFLYRMSMPRAPGLSVALQIVASYFILERRFKELAALCVIFVWTYNAFPTVAALVMIGVVVFAVTQKVFEYRLLVSAGIGLGAGLIVNPYFPQNVLFLWNHIVPKIFSFHYKTSVGSEWYPYSSWLFFSLSAVAMTGYLISVLWTNREEWLKEPLKLFWLLTASMYLFLMLKSRRFVEYFPPAAILLLAFAMRDSLARFQFRDLLRTANGKTILFAGTVLAISMMVFSMNQVRQKIREEPDIHAYEGGAKWLAKNTPRGSIVFNTDWDDFPMLFHYNTNNRYIVGLDADFLRLKNEALFRRYEMISRGDVSNPAGEILEKFDARFVLTDNRHKAFMKKAAADERFQKRYSDRYTTIYEILQATKPARGLEPRTY